MSEILLNHNIRMPGEWERHSATWLAWPNNDDYFEHRILDVEKTYIEIIKELHKGEMVKILIISEEKKNEIELKMKENEIDLSRIIFFCTKYVDVWIRDYGPTFLKNGKECLWIKWNYDAYNKKFPELFPDDNVFINFSALNDTKKIFPNISMEGGAIESNGHGVIMTTQECLVENRNDGKDKFFYEDTFQNILGAKKIIWLNKGLANDHTDGHIDEIARFISPNKILCSVEEDKNDINYERLQQNYKILQNSTDQNGNNFEIIKIPLPHMEYEVDNKKHRGKRAPVSYVNFYVGNEIVLVSIFNDPNDDKAISIIKECFPDKKVVGIDSRNLIYGGGAIHCITQQEPAL